jgi:hypothetical protein
MEIKKIVICGDSFCSADRGHTEHFSQVLEEEYGYSITNLAHGGVGTINICFQIQEAIKLQPDIIIHGQTTSDRIEIPYGNTKFESFRGLKNFFYWNKKNTSYGNPCVGDKNAPILSCHVSKLINGNLINLKTQEPDLEISKDQQQAAKMYLSFLHSPQLKKEVDSWLYEYWTIKILQSNIVSIPFLKTNFAKIAYDFATKTNNSYPRIYHTDFETQKKLAQLINDEIQKYIGCID